MMMLGVCADHSPAHPHEIGFAQPCDVDSWMRLAELVADNFPGLVLEEYVQTLEKNIARKTAICAKSDGEVTGALLYSVNSGTLSCMAVHPAYRKQGIASEMIRMMITNFPPDKDIVVTTFREGDPLGDAPRALYKKLGFVEGELVEEFGHPCQKFMRPRSSAAKQ